MIDSIQDLRCFLQIIDSGSLSAAARTQQVSTAYVSKRLQVLESAIQAKLFHRTTRALALTEDGERLAEHAKRILNEVEDAECSLAGTKRLRGTLHLSAPDSFGRKYVAPFVFEFMKSHPQLQVYLALSDRHVDLVEEGIDVSIRIYTPEKASEIVRKLADNQRILVASPSYVASHGMPKHPNQLNEHPCLAFPSDTEWTFQRGSDRVTTKPKRLFTTNTGDVLLQGALAGIGVTIKSTWDIQQQLKDGSLLRLLPEWEFDRPLGIYAVYSQSRKPPSRVRRFIDALVEAWSKKPPWELY